MPRSSRYGLSANGGLPETLQRSCKEAQAMFLKARAEALQAYGAGDKTYRVAYAALKQKFEKRGDHWVAKTEPAAGASGGLPGQDGQAAAGAAVL